MSESRLIDTIVECKWIMMEVARSATMINRYHSGM